MNELEIIQHRQIEGLSIFVNAVDHRTSHIHPEWELIWVLDAPLSVTCGQSSFVVSPGQMVLFSPNEPHEFHKLEKSAAFLCLQISADTLPVSHRLVADERLPHAWMTGEELQQLKQEMLAVAMAYLRREEHYALLCVGKTCLMFHMLFSRLPNHVLTADEAACIDRRNARLQRLIRFVDENYMHKLRLADFAEAEGCSLSYLSGFIKRAMNLTFQEYVNSVRFHCACKLMAAGDKRMLDVCMESGFSDYRYFCRAFRRQYDMTPEQYSRLAKTRHPESAAVRRSLHSIERIYTRHESLKLLQAYL